MVSSIRHLFTFNKKSSPKNASRQTSLSPSSSIASLSTLSSGPHTPTQSYFSPPDIRGIFRTLEPYWSFYHPEQQEWIAFDMSQADVLEHHYQAQDDIVHLAPCPGLDDGLTVYFRPFTQHNGPGLHLTLDRDLVRTVVPVWWYEQDLPDGSKGMCRFEHKNQVRLEALSDKTQLSLTDQGFEHAHMTVVTTPPQQLEQEEMRGLVYVYQSPPMESLHQKLDHLQYTQAVECSSPRRGSI